MQGTLYMLFLGFVSLECLAILFLRGLLVVVIVVQAMILILLIRRKNILEDALFGFLHK